MEEFFDIISGFLPFAIVAIGIIVTAVQRTKKAKAQQGSKNSSNSTSDNVFGEKGEQQNQPVGFFQNIKRVIAEELEKEKEEKPSPKSKEKEDPNDFRKKVEAMRVANENTHVHGAQSPTVGGKKAEVRTEKVPRSGSLGGESEEGCLEHRDERFVIEDIPTLTESESGIIDLQKYVVWAEILNKPKFKSTK